YTTIPKAPDHHVLLPSRWVGSQDTTIIDFYTSHDGKMWNKVRTGVLSPSNIGQWDGGGVWIFNPGQMAGRWGAAVWPKGRMMALEAVEEGRFTTMAFVAAGKTLRINAVTKRSG